MTRSPKQTAAPTSAATSEGTSAAKDNSVPGNTQTATPTSSDAANPKSARKVFYEAETAPTILLIMDDVTKLRAIESVMLELMRQKDVLLKEMEHRVETVSLSSQAFFY